MLLLLGTVSTMEAPNIRCGSENEGSFYVRIELVLSIRFTTRNMVDLYGKHIWLSEANRVMVSASIELPEKFENLLAREEERFYKFEGEEQ
jgi:hypothetical protein